jgi:hypothetical protein
LGFGEVRGEGERNECCGQTHEAEHEQAPDEKAQRGHEGQNASNGLGSQGLAGAPNLAYGGSVTLVRRNANEAVLALLDHRRRFVSLRASEQSQVFWGDTHLHTSYSPDAFFFGNATADPDTAYRYAKGYPVVHPYHKAKIQIGTPLDFLVVADHAEMMGVPFRLAQGDERLTKTASGKRIVV